ncbi:uncharacterized protein CMC5_047720 [Chondromyces crocatus]|uniref:Uncharacterized protein n=1 Tax=Chondromyces crocatus TaxID=52 RepID=A0A0K1EID0_CHOCO|nr:uncharacterized protein CMC5_047720 [Chondromyces crocatus]
MARSGWIHGSGHDGTHSLRIQGHVPHPSRRSVTPALRRPTRNPHGARRFPRRDARTSRAPRKTPWLEVRGPCSPEGRPAPKFRGRCSPEGRLAPKFWGRVFLRGKGHPKDSGTVFLRGKALPEVSGTVFLRGKARAEFLGDRVPSREGSSPPRNCSKFHGRGDGVGGAAMRIAPEARELPTLRFEACARSGALAVLDPEEGAGEMPCRPCCSYFVAACAGATAYGPCAWAWPASAPASVNGP